MVAFGLIDVAEGGELVNSVDFADLDPGSSYEGDNTLTVGDVLTGFVFFVYFELFVDFDPGSSYEGD